ncbi:hypothetical protein B0H10DRAFT_2210751 [Mycena sp. CBHHK59/15]|nr:hypothetical protein B0H10DRAFT_2210751 [Mycena sp. CBHHK59/15]
MFHSTLSRSPISNPRERYLTALAEAKEAEAQYLAAERLQEEEDHLRQRLEQIQLLKQKTSQLSFDSTPLDTYARPQYETRPAPVVLGANDLESLCRQIAVEERARIVREQQQQQEFEALRKQQQQVQELEARRREQQTLELEAFRIHEARKAQAARDNERARALAAQRNHLAALTLRSQEPAVRLVFSGDNAAPTRKHHCRPQKAHSHDDLPSTVGLADLLASFTGAPERRRQTAPQPRAALDLNEILQAMVGTSKAQKEPKPAAPVAIEVQDLLTQLLGGRSESEQAPKAPENSASQPPAAPQAVDLEQLLGHLFGAHGATQAQPSKSAAAAQPRGEIKADQPAEKKETTTPAPQQVKPEAKAEQQAAQPVQPVSLEQILSQVLGGFQHPQQSSSTNTSPQVEGIQQLLNMFMGGHAHAQPQKESAQASSSKPASTDSALKHELEARFRSQQSSEEQDLQEAIRMSLAASPSESKGKAPAPPAPVKDVATSTAEVKAIDASFTALSSEFVFPAQLDFSTSRTSSPNRTGEPESVTSRLSYSAHNQPVRFYHQALNGFLGQLDSVESFGDDALRHQRKDIVGRVEGALDELERVIEACWRKFIGKEERKEEMATPVSEPEVTPSELVVAESAPVPAAAVELEDAPVVVAAEDVAAAADEAPVDDIPKVANGVTDSATEDPIPDTTTTTASYPPTAAESESVETIRPYDASPASPESIDTFLLPADSTESPKQPAKAAEPEDVGSDWSEVDA